MSYGRKMNEIEKFWINPELLNILGVNYEELVHECVISPTSFHFKRDGKTYGIDMRFGYDKDDKNHISLEQHMDNYSIGVNLIRLDNVTTSEHIKRFRKLMDTYFADYIIKEDVKDGSPSI